MEVISSTQRLLHENSHHSQQTNTSAPGGIRNHNLKRRAAADLRLRLRGQWDRIFTPLVNIIGYVNFEANKHLKSTLQARLLQPSLKKASISK